jgi:putative effector of murein hydrolase LrgA (UPF0299 family)
MNEFLGIPIFDNDIYKMLFRFVLNIAFLSLIIRGLYFSTTSRKDFLFTYYMIGIIVFFICFTLKKFELDLGMALGLFAIFGIIRYRTDTIKIREMTYLFVVIGVSVINALANQKMSYLEILGCNILIIGVLYVLEKIWLLKKTAEKKIAYEVIDNIKPENYEILKADLEERTGLEITYIEIGDVDFLKDAADIKITYKINE